MAAQQSDTPAPLQLDHYLPYLINRAGVSLATRFSATLRQAGITLQDWRVLAALREKNGQRLTELAQRTSVEVSTLSRLVGGLEAAGMVSRGRDSDDARAIAIRLTPAGEAATAALTPAAQQLEGVAVAGLSAAEIAQLKALLERIYANLAEMPAADDSAAYTAK
ncbi:MAG: MarR family transcriptional regulator [Ferrovibrio sp.]|uniref:MarR family winged helix-turn-helix transcriptional regulator n=1 Tax=Ferrovibrio sp. TaxID=1917215 RepID=UPI0026117639|nr:MarR family transcriptional regulator [Ferrovibrio sp.]MCW0232022.1 MarR family transcriptional regulator [Ferrovibrio sp.]